MKKGIMNKAVVIVLSLASVFDLFINVARFLFADQVNGEYTRSLITNALPDLILSMGMIIIALIYLIHSYKKPHGNTLKHIFVVFAFYMIVPIIPALNAGRTISMLIYFCCAVIIAYIGGRLAKRRKNVVLTSIVFVLFIANTIYTAVSLDYAGMEILSRLGQWYIINEPIIWAVICTAYFSRFKAHRQAGKDADKN